MAADKQPSTNPDLTAFLASFLQQTKERDPARAELRQISGSGEGALVRRVARTHVADVGAEAFAEEARTLAQLDCDALGETQRYAVVAYRGEESLGRHLFRVRPRSRSTCATCGNPL